MVKRGRRGRFSDFSRIRFYTSPRVLTQEFIEGKGVRKNLKYGSHLIMAGWYGRHDQVKYKSWLGCIAIFTKSFEAVKKSLYYWSEQYIIDTINHEVLHAVIEDALGDLWNADGEFLHWPLDRGMDERYYLERIGEHINDPNAFRSCPVIYG